MVPVSWRRGGSGLGSLSRLQAKFIPDGRVCSTPSIISSKGKLGGHRGGADTRSPHSPPPVGSPSPADQASTAPSACDLGRRTHVCA